VLHPVESVPRRVGQAPRTTGILRAEGSLNLSEKQYPISCQSMSRSFQEEYRR